MQVGPAKEALQPRNDETGAPVCFSAARVS
jgi:hypothetical protein